MKRTRRTVNYASRNRGRSGDLQLRLLDIIADQAEGGFTFRRLGELAGIGRQLALYHTKKLAALGLVILQLGPCSSNSGLQFTVWTDDQLRELYSRPAQRAISRAA